VPSIAPDGSRVAYMSTRQGDSPNIWMLDLGTGESLQLTDDDAYDRWPSWSPDGRRVAYTSETATATGIFTVDVETRRRDLVIRTDRVPDGVEGSDPLTGRLAEIQLSPSARRVAFAMAVPPLGFRRLYVSDIAPFGPRAVTDGTVSIGYPAWSPDERRLAVEIQTDGVTELGIVDLASGQLRVLTSLGGQVWGRSWSPDGRRVAAAVLRERRWSLEWFDTTTGATGTLVPPGPVNVYVRYPDWSPRGDLVVFERGEMRGNIWRLTLPAPSE
jgi:Tol biopolymer transport system component